MIVMLWPAACPGLWRGPGTAVTAVSTQEQQIARLVRDSRSNPEIGTQLFLRAPTVEWHLRKMFTKLGISSRHQLKEALAQLGRDRQPAVAHAPVAEEPDSWAW